MMLRRCLLAGAAICASAISASATGTIACANPEGDAAVHLSIGSLPVLAVIGAEVTVGDESFVLARGEAGAQDGAAEPMIVGHAFWDDERIIADFTDPDVLSVVVSLRLFQATEERDSAMAGTLAVAGIGAWPIICIGP